MGQRLYRVLHVQDVKILPGFAYGEICDESNCWELHLNAGTYTFLNSTTSKSRSILALNFKLNVLPNLTQPCGWSEQATALHRRPTLINTYSEPKKCPNDLLMLKDWFISQKLLIGIKWVIYHWKGLHYSIPK